MPFSDRVSIPYHDTDKRTDCSEQKTTPLEVGSLAFLLLKSLKNNDKIRSVFALTKPLDLWVWLSTVIALVLTPILATLVAKAELILGYQSNFFSSIWNSFWYGFSTLLGESITEEIAMKKTWAVRWGRFSFQYVFQQNDLSCCQTPLSSIFFDTDGWWVHGSCLPLWQLHHIVATWWPSWSHQTTHLQ